MRNSVRLCSAILAASLFGVGAAEASDPAALARDIVRIAGVKTGLLVHLGCGDGKLTVELAKAGRFLVRGLDANDANVRQARRMILSRKLYGLVSISREPMAPLPYSDNLVSLVVVHDAAALLAEGLSIEEVLRVLQPDGVACFLRENRSSCAAATISPSITNAAAES